MTRTITLSLPHDLSEAEVKSRIVSGIADARTKHPGILSGARETWSGNSMDFSFTSMGQSVTGQVDIEPKVVHLRVNLPAFLALIAERLRPKIQEEGRKLLGTSKGP